MALAFTPTNPIPPFPTSSNITLASIASGPVTAPLIGTAPRMGPPVIINYREAFDIDVHLHKNTRIGDTLVFYLKISTNPPTPRIWIYEMPVNEAYLYHCATQTKGVLTAGATPLSFLNLAKGTYMLSYVQTNKAGSTVVYSLFNTYTV